MVTVIPWAHGPTQDAANGHEKIELLVPNLEEILGIKLDRGLPRRWWTPSIRQPFLSRTSRAKSLVVVAVESSEMIVAAIFRGHNRLKGMTVRA